MVNIRKYCFPSAVLIGILSLQTFAWSGDLKGRIKAEGMRSPENIVVYIDNVPGKAFLPPVQPAIMDQLQMEFVPHVLVIVKGTTVNFMNDDHVQHNVYWPAINHDRKLAHNMGTWPKGIVKSFTFSDLGDVPLLCKVHAEMSGYIVVVPTPYFAVTNKQGDFTIKDVPPGKYTLKTWSEEARPTAQEVMIGFGSDAGAQPTCNLAPCNCPATQAMIVNLTVTK